VCFGVPPLFALADDDIMDRGFSLAFPDPESTAKISKWAGVEITKLKSDWKTWWTFLERALVGRDRFLRGTSRDLP
jgi:hypothetical protein